MNIIISVLAVIGLLVIILAAILYIRAYRAVQIDINSKNRSFTDIIELMSFIRRVSDCKIKHHSIVYGFVESVYKNNLLMKEGLSDADHLDIRVFLVTNNGHQEIDTVCGNNDASLKKGDFVAVLPLYNDRHNLWTYITVAKLHRTYLGKGKGFLVNENYID